MGISDRSCRSAKPRKFPLSGLRSSWPGSDRNCIGAWWNGDGGPVLDVEAGQKEVQGRNRARGIDAAAPAAQEGQEPAEEQGAEERPFRTAE